MSEARKIADKIKERYGWDCYMGMSGSKAYFTDEYVAGGEDGAAAHARELLAKLESANATNRTPTRATMEGTPVVSLTCMVDIGKVGTVLETRDGGAPEDVWVRVDFGDRGRHTVLNHHLRLTADSAEGN